MERAYAQERRSESMTQFFCTHPSQASVNGLCFSLEPYRYLPSCLAIPQFDTQIKVWGQILRQINLGRYHLYDGLQVASAVKNPRLEFPLAIVFIQLLKSLREIFTEPTAHPSYIICCTVALSLQSRAIIFRAATLAGLKCTAVLSPQYPATSFLTTDIYLVRLPLQYCTMRVEKDPLTWSARCVWARLFHTLCKDPPDPLTLLRDRRMELSAVASNGAEYWVNAEAIAMQVSAWAGTLRRSMDVRIFEEWPQRQFTVYTGTNSQMLAPAIHLHNGPVSITLRSPEEGSPRFVKEYVPTLRFHNECPCTVESVDQLMPAGILRVRSDTDEIREILCFAKPEHNFAFQQWRVAAEQAFLATYTMLACRVLGRDSQQLTLRESSYYVPSSCDKTKERSS